MKAIKYAKYNPEIIELNEEQEKCLTDTTIAKLSVPSYEQEKKKAYEICRELIMKLFRDNDKIYLSLLVEEANGKTDILKEHIKVIHKLTEEALEELK